MTTVVRRGERGSVEIADTALTQLVVQAAELVPGARARRPRRGVRVELADGTARVSVELAAPYGAVLPEVARAVQEHVAEALRCMLGVARASVDVSVEELEGP